MHRLQPHWPVQRACLQELMDGPAPPRQRLAGGINEFRPTHDDRAVQILSRGGKVLQTIGRDGIADGGDISVFGSDMLDGVIPGLVKAARMLKDEIARASCRERV